MSPPTRNGGPVGGPAVANHLTPARITKPDPPKGNGAASPVAVRAVAAYGPCRGRGLWNYAVTCSRGCGVHLHRGGPPRDGGHLRTAPCGETYLILTRTVLPALGGAA